LVLLFDEAETVDQLWNVRSRLSAYSVLDQLCSMRNLWCIFGITGRFQRTIDSDLGYAAANNLLQSRAGRFLRRWQEGSCRTVEPPKMDGKCTDARTRCRISVRNRVRTAPRQRSDH
jgi:hypothetical protein